MIKFIEEYLIACGVVANMVALVYIIYKIFY